jgi:hypothetical protein
MKNAAHLPASMPSSSFVFVSFASLDGVVDGVVVVTAGSMGDVM